MNKLEQMEKLKLEASALHNKICEPDTNIVWGEGNLEASLVLVGEAPGAQEDKTGRPFVGQAGRLLDRELAMAGISRDNVYIANTVKCRPTKLENGKKANRPPTTKEVKAWLAVLLQEIEVISPKVIICLGSVAASALIHPQFKMNAERGKWFEGPLGTQIMATFHPAYLLRYAAFGDTKQLEVFRRDLSGASNKLKTKE